MSAQWLEDRPMRTSWRMRSVHAFQSIVAASLCAGFFALPATAAPPDNDMVSEGIPVTGLPLHLVGNATEATVEPGEPTEIDPTFARRLEHSVWFSWTAQKSGVVGIYFGLDLVRALRVYTGDSWPQMSSVPLALSPRQTGPSRNISFLADWTFRADAGVTYHIGVYEAGVFTLDLMERPDNDFFADRIEIAPSGERFMCTTSNATYEFTEPVGGNKSVWYGWTPNFSGPAVALLFGGGGSEQLEAFSGTVVTQLQAVGKSAVGDALLLPFNVESGQAYAIRVSGNPSSAPFRLSIEHAPTNDSFASALPLSGYSALLEGTTYGTSIEPGEPPVNNPTATSGTAWWKWVAPASGLLRVKAGDFYRRVAHTLYRGNTLSSLLPERYVGNHAGDGYPDEYTVISNKTYYLRIQDSPLFHVEFALYPRPANDDFTRRERLPGLTGATVGQNYLASRQGGEPYHGGSRAGHSVWWTWTAPLSGHLFVATVGSDFNNVIAAYTGDNLKSLSPVADNRYSYFTGVLTFPVTSGTTYQIAVDGVMEPIEEVGLRPTRGGVELNYLLTTLRMRTPTQGSVYVGPADVVLSLDIPMEAVDGRIVGVEYYTSSGYTVQTAGSVATAPFSLTASNILPGLHVFAAIATNHLGEVRPVPPVVFTVRPPNDSFSERISLASEPGTVRGWVAGGSWESWEKRPGWVPPNAGSSWWVWTAPETGTYRVDMLTYTSMVAYREASGSKRRPVGRFYPGNNEFHAVAGETYYLQVFSAARLPWEGVDPTVEFSLTR